MNLKESPRKLWAVIGAAGSLLIVAASYLLLISGQKATEQDLKSQADSARQMAAVSKQKLIGLRQDDAKLSQYKARLAVLEKALPRTSATAQFVADMQLIAVQSGVKITAINVTPPVTGQGAGGTPKVAGATPLPITVAAKGATANLEKFVSLLQTKAPRAVLVDTVSETVPDTGGPDAVPTMNIGMKAFFGRS